MNFLVILLDDIGIEQFNRFGRGSNYPATPTIDAWYDGGVRFTKFYVQQLCSPTRATLLTGAHPFRHGIGDLVRGPLQTTPTKLRVGLNYPTIAHHLREHASDMRTAAIGKWHVSTEFEGGLQGPARLGFEHFSVMMFNIPGATVDGGPSGRTYYEWDKNVRGKLVVENEYIPAVNVREAAEWINQRGKEPWLMYLAPYSCHTPLEVTGIPPTGTFDAGWNTATANGVFKACIESVDHYLGVLQSSIPANVWAETIVFLMTDNGSGVQNTALETDPLTGTTYPLSPSRSKDTPYDLGTHAPLIVYNSGSLITSPGRTVAHPVQIADIVPTVLAYLGITASKTLDGKSLKGYLDHTSSSALHGFVYSEHFLQNNGVNTTTGETFSPVPDAPRVENQWMAYDGQYTLVYNRPLNTAASDALFEFYDLTADPHQLTNLTPGGVTSSLTAGQAAARSALLAGRTALLLS